MIANTWPKMNRLQSNHIYKSLTCLSVAMGQQWNLEGGGGDYESCQNNFKLCEKYYNKQCLKEVCFLNNFLL